MNARTIHFQTLYDRSSDPWSFETSPYERNKYAATLEALGGRRYHNAIEVGCSIGVLSAMLAGRCTRFLGVELNEKAARRARERLAGRVSARVLVAEVPRTWPRDCYDLVVLSEILYFLSADEIEQVAGHVARDLQPGGDCVLVNWLGDTDTELDGEAASALFRERLATRVTLDEIRLSRTDRYELRVLRHSGRRHSGRAQGAA